MYTHTTKQSPPSLAYFVIAAPKVQAPRCRWTVPLHEPRLRLRAATSLLGTGQAAPAVLHTAPSAATVRGHYTIHCTTVELPVLQCSYGTCKCARVCSSFRAPPTRYAIVGISTSSSLSSSKQLACSSSVSSTRAATPVAASTASRTPIGSQSFCLLGGWRLEYSVTLWHPHNVEV